MFRLSDNSLAGNQKTAMKYIAWTAIILPLLLILCSLILWATGNINLDMTGWLRIGIGSAILLGWGVLQLRRLRGENITIK